MPSSRCRIRRATRRTGSGSSWARATAPAGSSRRSSSVLERLERLVVERRAAEPVDRLGHPQRVRGADRRTQVRRALEHVAGQRWACRAGGRSALVELASSSASCAYSAAHAARPRDTPAASAPSSSPSSSRRSPPRAGGPGAAPSTTCSTTAAASAAARSATAPGSARSSGATGARPAPRRRRRPGRPRSGLVAGARLCGARAPRLSSASSSLRSCAAPPAARPRHPRHERPLELAGGCSHPASLRAAA